MSAMTMSLRPLLTLILCSLLLALFDGCSCWKDPFGKAGKTAADIKRNPDETLEEMEERRKKLLEEKEEKPDFETTRLVVMPADDSPTKNQVKPGHWFGAVQTMKANNFDFPKGDLDAQCVDTRGNPIPLPGTRYDLRTTRPVSLPKGQEKHFDMLLFANMPEKGGAINFMTRLRPRGGGREVDWKHEVTTRMKPFQNHMVVLAELPDNYQFLKSLRSVKPGRPNEDFLATELDYFIKLPKGEKRVDLPTHALTWTNIAYVVWDKYDPDNLNSSQQQALLDWLHWGGQLVINGPRTLDRLAGSILGPYLPARAGAKVSKLSNEEIATLNDNWTFETRGASRLTVSEEEKRPDTIELELTDSARFVPNTADLVAETHVGRGRVVATAFNIPHPTLRRWDSFDSFFNACLLDRPARKFREGQNTGIVEDWNAGNLLYRDDPRVTSKLRFFSRDAMALSRRSRQSREQALRETQRRAERNNPNRNIYYRNQVRANQDRIAEMAAAAAAADEQLDVASAPPPEVSKESEYAFGVTGFAKNDLVGVAGWSDQSDVSQAARASLERSAGISVPSIDFIARVLGIYLLVLVPLNWIMFRLMSRVEWAWAAVPLIAIGGAIGVARVAQLDIGFARSRTEIAIIEVQPDYDRAHLSRYVGFYTSLSSSYEIAGDDETTLLQPLASSQPVNDRRVSLYQGSSVNLTGFNVLSNSTGLVHGEQMIYLGGKFSFESNGGVSKLNNQTDYGLKACAIVRRTEDGTVEYAWLGDVDAKTKYEDISFQPLTSGQISFPEWEAEAATRKDSSEGDLNIRRIIDIATDPKRLGLGEVMFVGHNDQVVGGITVSPAAPQITARTVFVVQLHHAERPAPQRDINCYAVMGRSKAKREKENLNNFDAGTF